MQIRVQVNIPYEGESSYHFSSLKEAVEWLKESNQYPLDDIEVMEVRYIDVYKLMSDHK